MLMHHNNFLPTQVVCAKSPNPDSQREQLVLLVHVSQPVAHTDESRLGMCNGVVEIKRALVFINDKHLQSHSMVVKFWKKDPDEEQLVTQS